MPSRHPSIPRTLRILGASSLFVSLVACSGATGSATGQTSAALTTTLADGGAIAISACLTSYVECVRGDAGSCRQTLHDCLRPGDGDGRGGGGACDNDGGPNGPPLGSDGGAPPPRPNDGDGDDLIGADGGAPPPGGPAACLDTLDQCPASSETSDACASAAETCFAALPAPHGGGHHRR
jgi:hypothetical protein